MELLGTEEDAEEAAAAPVTEVAAAVDGAAARRSQPVEGAALEMAAPVPVQPTRQRSRVAPKGEEELRQLLVHVQGVRQRQQSPHNSRRSPSLTPHPTPRPSAPKHGPPELPPLIAASIWLTRLSPPARLAVKPRR